MSEKDTDELTNILGKTHIAEFDQFYQEQKDSMTTEKNDFYVYIKDCFREHKMTQQKVFLKADIPERYGYKLLSGEKTTKQRDIILRICYAGELTLQECQRALEKYGMPKLYPKDKRDAFLMIAFQERPGSILDVNGLLKSHNLDPLRTSGIQN